MFGAAKIATYYKGGGGPALTYSYVTSSTASGSTIAIPTVQTGDIGLFYNIASVSSTTIPTEAAPSGWTSIANSSVSASTSQRTVVYYKTLTSAESGTTLTSMSGLAGQKLSIIVYRPSSTVTTYTVSSLNQQTTTSAPTNQTLAMTGVTGPYIAVAYYGSSGNLSTKGSTTTGTRDIGGGAGSNAPFMAKTFEATSSSVSFSSSTISQSDDGTNTLISFILSIA